MKILDCVQGTPEWHEARRTYYRTASTASVMMGRNGSRNDAIRQVATGIELEVSDWVKENLFDKGHEIEDMARSIAEEIIGEALYPVTAITNDGYLLASYDGLTIGEDVAWECKSWNEDKVRRMLADGLVPLEDRYQVMQQLAVMGPCSRVLYMITNGTPERCETLMVEATGEEYATLAPHWEQFDMDVMAYQLEAPATATVTGAAPEFLPALRIELEGRVLATNLDKFRDRATAVIQSIKTELVTDQDFADAEQTVKWCDDAESRLSGAKEAAMAQTASIDALFKTIDAISEQIRSKRLLLTKLVKSEKENRRAALVMKAHEEIRQHRDTLNKRIGGNWMPITQHPFGEAVKGLKSLKSMEDKLSTAIAQAKVAESAMADRIQANREALIAADRGLILMPDFAQVCQKEQDDFLLLLNSRLQADEERLQAAREQAAKEESERIAREQEAKTRAEAMAHGAATRQQAIADAPRVAVQAIQVPQPDPRAVVVESEAIIAQFLASREWKKGEETRIRAILVEFVKFQSTGMKKEA